MLNPTFSGRRRWAAGLVLAGLIVLFPGCQTAYYKTMEKIGFEKRDILVKRVKRANDAQTDTKEQFQSALQRFKSVVAFEGGELEEKYETLKDEFERCEDRAEQVHDRIAAVQDVADDLFKEWQAELKTYTNANLRRASQHQYDQTRRRYARLLAAMKRAESKIEPVLNAFRDQVLFLKHNLNARAIASLQSEVRAIEGDVAGLIKDMEAAIAEADGFIRTMQQS